MKKHVFVLLTLTLVAGCSGGSGTNDVSELPEHIRELENLTVYPADAEASHTIDLSKVQTFGDSDEPLITEITGVAVDDHDRVILADRSGQNNTLHAFSSDGSYYSQIGRSGQGPGEYQFIGDLQIKSGMIYIHDARASRVNVYSADDFSFIESVIPQQWGVTGHEAVSDMRYAGVSPRNDGNYLLRFTGSPLEENKPVSQKQLIVDSSGLLVSDNVIESSDAGSLALSQGGMNLVMYGLPFMGRTFQVFSEDDEIYSVWSDEFLIKKYDASGNYQSAFYHQPQKTPFDADTFFEDRFNIGDFDVRSAVESAIGTPETWPFLEQLRMDDESRFWAAVIIEDQEIYEWWVMEESGELLVKFDMSRDRQIMAIKNGHLYTRETDEVTGLQTIEKYRIQLTDR